MRLKRLEMVGFKSFADKTLVELNPGITAVVGPNGCGKSNIVDALRWAMGEQSARHLRGQQMEDVVFAGSDSLPATGMAEVSLTFDNEDGRGPVEYNSYSEIMVTRRLFRSGESEYAINKTPCRLKDVIELFLGTGVGSKAYSIVEQGRVDELVNSKPEERRVLIEEAAGTSKYKSRKLVAERKLERTQQNLLRVTDIVREIERQIRTMELQAKKAERYRVLKTELKEKDLLWASVQRRTLNEEIARQENQFDDAENRFAQYLNSLHSKESESETVRFSLMELEKEIGVQQESVYQAKMHLQSEEQRIDFFKKDLAQLSQNETEARAALLQLDGKLNVLAQEIAELNKARESFIQLSLFEESFLRDNETELAKLQTEIQSLQSEVDTEKAALLEVANHLANLQNDLAAKTRRQDETQRGLARSQNEHSATAHSLELSEKKRSEAQQDFEVAIKHARERNLESAHVTALIQTLSRTKEEQAKKIDSLKEQIQESRSRLRSLEDLQRSYDGYQEGVRAIMLKRQEESGADGVCGLVTEVVEAPVLYEKALTAVLGDRIQYMIVKGHEEGIEAIEYLKQKASGRGSFIPVQMTRKSNRPLPLGEAEVVAPLLDLISVKEGYRDVADYLLSDVVVVQNLKAGLALWNRNGYYSTLVTPDGEVIDPMGVVTGGSENSLEGSFLTQRRRMKELRCLLGELEAQLEIEDRELAGLKANLEEAEAKKMLLGGEIHRLELERVRNEHEHRSAQQDSERLKRTVDVLLQEQGDLATVLQLLREEIAQCNASLEARAQEKTERAQNLAAMQNRFLERRNSLESVEAAVTQSRIRNAALGEKRENTHVNLDNRLKLQEDTGQQISSRHGQIAEIQRKRSEIENALAQAEKAQNTGRTTMRELEEKLQSERQRYRNVSRQLTEIEESIKELRPRGEACQEEKNRLQLGLTEKRLNLQHLADGVREKYDADLSQLKTPDAETTPSSSDLLSEIDELRGRLDRMGDVNMAAIGEYEELTTRFQFMNQQKEDLEKSIADLHQTIVKLNRVCRVRFKESFEEINEKFQAIFPRMFSGGKARLVLTDENDYLETGVDIVVQPPGKKLQSITLLSGGEKALTAVSLLFAIFLTKPSPFCFLDEVDAPLDDANVDRFNELVKEMSEFSQFVLITHNKKTMQAAEILYGITMAEPGVSKLVSVRMN
ncbi:MAG: chromosome segregation protein SMC [Deltaproteobacteria bacterium]|nr:chromosome segregation protein SMC [Deltaproteobacteria bacterium]